MGQQLKNKLLFSSLSDTKISPVSAKFLCVLLLYASFITAAVAETVVTPSHWNQEREQYTKALQLLEVGQLVKFRSISEKLSHYPLAPYLEYHYLRKYLSQAGEKRINQFLTDQASTPLAMQLRYRWLLQLASQGQWQTYLENYSPTQSVELQCYALRAEHQLGSPETALNAVESIWLADHSQPRACDPLFKLWQDDGRLNDELVARRFSMAMLAGNTQLAGYLMRLMSGENLSWARLYQEIHFHPERIGKLLSNKALASKHRQILSYGIKRLASQDAEKAGIYLNEIDNLIGLTDPQRDEIEHLILLKYARENKLAAYQSLLRDHPHQNDINLLTAGITMYIRVGQWKEVLDSIPLLPASEQQTHRWRYWKARAALESGDIALQETAGVELGELARERDYYGFMAAERVNVPYQLNQQSYQISREFMQQLKSTAGMIRATELHALGHEVDSRREWQALSLGFSADQHYSAAHYAHQLGWHDQAIRSTILAERWNDLQLRFPRAYEGPIVATASALGLNEEWIFAIARQESAMTADVRSPKGALGLMQLMPATAQMVARKHSISYRNKSELLNGNKNILLGSHHLSDLLRQFDGNVIHATAAYNAGSGRVRQWLTDSNNQPMDVWIESIPYAETRQYVKNVLAYTAIFANLRDSPDFRMATAQYLPYYPALNSVSN